MEFRKEAEKIFQQYLPQASDYVRKHEEEFRITILDKCESLQKYFDEKTAQGLSYRTLIGDIKREIEKLEAEIKQAEAAYNSQYPPRGSTTKTVFHLDEQTGKLSPEERSNIPPNWLFKTKQFQNRVLIDFLQLLRKDFEQRKRIAELPSQEERLAQEARATAIIQAAQEKAEADFQKLVSKTLPRQLAKYAKAEHAEFISKKMRELHQWLDNNWQPWYDFEAFSQEELVIHFLASDVIRTQDETFLKIMLAKRITKVRYVEHLAALADGWEQVKQQEAREAGKGSKARRPGQFNPGPELEALIRKALQAKGLLGEQGQFIGKKRHIRAIYNVLTHKGHISGSYKEQAFAAFFSQTFGFAITGRTLQNAPIQGQKEEEQDFKALL